MEEGIERMGEELKKGRKEWVKVMNEWIKGRMDCSGISFRNEIFLKICILII